MLDIKFIRENKEAIAKNCESRRVKINIDELLKLDEKRRDGLKKIEILANINSAPKVRVRGLKEDDLDINLSISHCSSRAIAFALIVKDITL